MGKKGKEVWSSGPGVGAWFLKSTVGKGLETRLEQKPEGDKKVNTVEREAGHIFQAFGIACYMLLK